MMAKLLADTANGRSSSRLFAGNISEYDDDESRADLALCVIWLPILAHQPKQSVCPDPAQWAVSREVGARRLPRADDRESARGEGLCCESTPADQTGGRVQILSARELARQELSPVRYVVHRLVPEGLTLFAGDAKIGKSWAVLGMGLAVTTGERVFGYFDTEPGDVLYFALEDSRQRLKDRLDTLGKGGSYQIISALSLSAHRCLSLKRP